MSFSWVYFKTPLLDMIKQAFNMFLMRWFFNHWRKISHRSVNELPWWLRGDRLSASPPWRPASPAWQRSRSSCWCCRRRRRSWSCSAATDMPPWSSSTVASHRERGWQHTLVPLVKTREYQWVKFGLIWAAPQVTAANQLAAVSNCTTKSKKAPARC